MKQALLRNLVLGARDVVLRAPRGLSHGNTSPISQLFGVPLLKIRSFSSENEKAYRALSKLKSRHQDVAAESVENARESVEDVPKEVLKKQLEQFLEGDEDVISDIFESVMRRTLVGNHDESDAEIMDDYCKKKPVSDAVYNSLRASNPDLFSDVHSDSESDNTEDEDDF